MLPEQAIKEFKEIYLKEEGIALSDEEATKKATNMLNLFKALLKPTGSNIVRSVGLTKGRK